MLKNYNNYHRRDINEKIRRDAEYIFSRTLNGYAGKTVMINGYDVKVLLYEKYDSDGKAYKIASYPSNIERGNQVVYDRSDWIITSKPENNEVYKKAVMELCTAYFPLVTKGETIIIGYDKMGRPVTERTPDVIDNLPCIVKMSDSTTAIAETNEPVDLLKNQVRITIPYRIADSIAYNERFTLHGVVYRIIRINHADSIGVTGILHITGERVEGAEG